MKTSILMTIMGLFMAFATISFAGSTDSSLPECCKKQEACCVKDAACCKGNNVTKESSDCCEQKEECCESKSSCCATDKLGGNYKQQFHSTTNSVKDVQAEIHSASCCQ